MCFWKCSALMKGYRRDRYIATTRQLFIGFYERYNENYLGQDFVNELDRLKAKFEFAINIIEYNTYREISCIRGSEIPDRK